MNNAIQHDTRVIILNDNVEPEREPANLATFGLTDPDSAELYRYLDLQNRIHNLSEYNYESFGRTEHNKQGLPTGQDLQDIWNRGYLNLEGTVDSSDDIRNAILDYLLFGTEIPSDFAPEIRSQTLPD